MKVHSGFRSHLCSYCSKSFYWAHSLRTHIASHQKENKKNMDALDSCETPFVEIDKKIPTQTNNEVLNKTLSSDSFTILTSELNELGLDSFQIITVGSANEDTKTFTLYSSEPNNDQLSLVNSSIALSAISL